MLLLIAWWNSMEDGAKVPASHWITQSIGGFRLNLWSPLNFLRYTVLVTARKSSWIKEGVV